MVRQPLMWAGGADATAVFRDNAAMSEEEASHIGLLLALQQVFGGDEFTATDVSQLATLRWDGFAAEMPAALSKRVGNFKEAEGAELQGRIKEALGARTNSDLRNAMTVGHVLGKLDRKRIEVSGGVWNLRMRLSAGRKVYRIEK